MSLSYPYTLKINSVDFGSKVQKYTYQTRYDPVYSDTITTMDKVDHNVIIRWRHGLSVTLNPMSEAELNTLWQALYASNVCSVQFSSLQLNSDVTANMVLSPESAEMVLKNATRRVIGSLQLSFTEL